MNRRGNAHDQQAVEDVTAQDGAKRHFLVAAQFGDHRGGQFGHGSPQGHHRRADDIRRHSVGRGDAHRTLYNEPARQHEKHESRDAVHNRHPRSGARKIPAFHILRPGSQCGQNRGGEPYDEQRQQHESVHPRQCAVDGKKQKDDGNQHGNGQIAGQAFARGPCAGNEKGNPSTAPSWSRYCRWRHEGDTGRSGERGTDGNGELRA